MRFSFKEMKDIYNSLSYELEEGQTINIHHCKQGHGNDRLYISHKGAAFSAPNDMPPRYLSIM